MGFTLFYLERDRADSVRGVGDADAWKFPGRDFWQLATTDRALAAYRLTFGASLVAAVGQRGFRHAAGLGAGALRISRPAVH